MISKTKTVPEKSLLKEIDSSFHYVDSFSCDFKDEENKIGFSNICEAFFTSKSKWISNLMTFRDYVVKIFGLKTSSKISGHQIENFKLERGQRLGIFKVLDQAENELILGEDDKHLNFRISILLDNRSADTKKLTITTIVEFMNWLGRLYFLIVKPFHRLIVPSMLNGIIAKLEVVEN